MTAQVHIYHSGVSPLILDIKEGDNVIWSCETDNSHIICTSEDFSFDSGPLRFDENFYYTFNRPGCYLYIDSISHKIGSITVRNKGV